MMLDGIISGMLSALQSLDDISPAIAIMALVIYGVSKLPEDFLDWLLF